jgi:hypothetical protein
MRTRRNPAPAATLATIRATRKALADLVESGRLEEARPLARLILQEVAALERAGFTRPVRATDLDLCRRVVDRRPGARTLSMAQV